MAIATEPVTSVAEDAWRLLFELAKRKHSVLVPALAELDLTPVQGHALRLLDPERPIAMSALADALFCHASNVTGIVDRLETRGLVERQAGREDRRVKMLALTEAGTRVRSKVVELMRTPPPEIASLSARDQRALRDVLARALDR
ncbi:MAG TPA: MarR family transcriptional regulator [Gaiellaceae bacterium]|nr:MarR family transcriptional regulator [Gaiellaceae bacterium]